MNRFAVTVMVSVLLTTVQAQYFFGGIINPKFFGYLKGQGGWSKLAVPEAPEFPTYERPDFLQLAQPSVPEVPEYSRPEVPEFKFPSVPGVPEYPQPKSPEYPGPKQERSIPSQPEQPPVPAAPESRPEKPQAPGAPDQPPTPDAPGSKPEQPAVPEAPNSAPEKPPVPAVPEYSPPKGRKARETVSQPQQPSLPEGSDYSLPELPADVQTELPSLPDVSDYSVPQASPPSYTTLGHPVFDVDFNQDYEDFVQNLVQKFPFTEYAQPQVNATESDYQPQGIYNYYAQPANDYYAPEYDYKRNYVVEGEGSYYRLDTCEYRFILDMVQCHQEEHHTEKVHYQSTGSDNYHNHNHHQAPHYNQNYDYDNRVPYFSRLYGNPAFYSHSHYQPGHYDSGLFAYQPSVGNPFYAPGLHNTPFAKYYAGFKNAHLNEDHESGRRAYHKDGYYQTALQDFNNLRLQNVVNYTQERDASEKSTTKVTTSEPQAYEGVTPYFNYNVRLMPNHCTLPGLADKHTCIVFSGATHPFKNIQRQFIYVTKTHEIDDKYRFRYEDGQSGSYH